MDDDQINNNRKLLMCALSLAESSCGFRHKVKSAYDDFMLVTDELFASFIRCETKSYLMATHIRDAQSELLDLQRRVLDDYIEKCRLRGKLPVPGTYALNEPVQ